MGYTPAERMVLIMDLQKIIADVVEKLTKDDSLVKTFLANPAKFLKDKFGIEITDEQVQAVVTAVKSKLNLGKASGILAKLGSLFGKGR